MASVLDELLRSVRTAHAEALVEIENQNVALKAEIARLMFPSSSAFDGDREEDCGHRIQEVFVTDPRHQTAPSKGKLKPTFQESNTGELDGFTSENVAKQRLKPSAIETAGSHSDVAKHVVQGIRSTHGSENPHGSHSASQSMSGSSTSFRAQKRSKGAQLVDEVRDPDKVEHCSDQLLRAIDHMNSTRVSTTNAEVRGSNRQGSIQSILTTTRVIIGLHLLRRVVHNIKFDIFCTLVILFNGVMLGFEVHFLAKGRDAPSSFFYIDLIVVTWYCIELVMRYCSDRLVHNRGWNIFDFLMVVASIGDLAVDVDTIPSRYHFLRFLRFVRMLRILKVLRMGKRMNRYFLVLSKMTLSMSQSLPSLLSAAIVLIFVTYFCAVMLTQTATDYREQEDIMHSDTFGLQENFGSLDRTFYSLMKSIFNGQNWGQLLQPLTHVGVAPSGIFLVYVMLSFLCFLNVIHAVFVDSAIQSTNQYKEFSIAEAQQKKVLLLNDLREVFQEIDTDHSGFVTTSEFDACLSTDGGKAFFEVLGLSSAQANELFRLMDADGSGSVDIDEFLDGCTRFTGEAKNFDIQCILLETRQTMAKWNNFIDNFESVVSVALATSLAHTSPKRLGTSFGSLFTPSSGDVASLQAMEVPPNMKSDLPVLEETGVVEEKDEPAVHDTSCMMPLSGNSRRRQAL